MKTKTQRILSIVLMAIPTLVLIAGGTMKLMDKEPETVVQFLTEAGFGSYMALLGLTGIIIAALLIFPKTKKIGFLLASCYFSGALSLEISGGQAPVSAGFLVILWVSMFLGYREVFLPVNTVE